MRHPTGQQLTEHVMDQLAEGKRRQIDRHLARCKECQARMRERKALAGAIRHSQAGSAGGPGPRVTFQALPTRPRRDTRWEQQRRIAAWAVAAATLILVVLTLLHDW